MENSLPSRRISSPFGLHGWLFNGFVVADNYLGRRRVDRWLGGVRRFNRDRLAEILVVGNPSDPLRRPMPDVAEHDTLDVRTFKRHFQRESLPVLIRGMAADWPAVARWSPSTLDGRLGDTEIMTIDGLVRSIEDEEGGVAHVTTVPMTLRDQLQAASEGGAAYLCFDSSLFERDPELLADLDIDCLAAYVGPLPLSRLGVPVKLFIGGDGTSTQWHTDMLQTTFVQLRGYKQWYLAPPAYSPCLDARVALLDQQYVHSMIDFRDPNLARHPLYARLPVFSARLGPGDVLYVPSFWWHCVVNEGTSIGVSVWWYSLLHPVRTNLTFLWLTVLSPQHIWRSVANALRRRRKGGGRTSDNIYQRHDPTCAPSPD